MASKIQLRSRSEMKKARFIRTPIAAVFLLIFASIFILVVIIQKLPQPDINTTTTSLSSDSKQTQSVGQFGQMMIDMLPVDLPFTIFLPSESAFSQILKLKVNESLKGERLNDTAAVLSRVLGFSVVPRAVYSGEVVVDGEEKVFDSLSGFRLGIWKEADGRLVVNGVRSESVDFKVGECVVHVMDGVIMDADFEQSFRDEDDDDEG